MKTEEMSRENKGAFNEIASSNITYPIVISNYLDKLLLESSWNSWHMTRVQIALGIIAHKVLDIPDTDMFDKI